MHRLVRPLATLVAAGTIALAVAACSGARADQPTEQPAGSPASGGPVVTIQAKNLAFTTATVTAPANTPFEISFDNQDGAPHNVALYRDPSAAEKVSIGEIFGGPATKVQEVPALAPGTYFFRCDVHPDMKGTLVVQ